MDVLQLSAAGSAGMQGVEGSLQPPKMADVVSKMSSAIDNAVSTGKLTDAQAASMKKDLDDVAKALQQEPTGSATQLPAGDRQQLGSEIREIGKQLRAALGSQGGVETEQNKAPGSDALRGARQGQNFSETNPIYGSTGRSNASVNMSPGSFSLLA